MVILITIYIVTVKHQLSYPHGQQSPKNHSDKKKIRQEKTQPFDVIHGVQHNRYVPESITHNRSHYYALEWNSHPSN